MILGYPVITSGTFAHEGSFRNLLGEAYEQDKEKNMTFLLNFIFIQKVDMD